MIAEPVNFGDIFKKGINDLFSVNIPWLDILLVLVISLLLGLVVYFVYNKSYGGVVYSHTFATSLILMTVITSAIILTISSNVVLSLGMVGALSIVRFRAAIKDPLDIVYLFFAISLGIIVGAKQYVFAALACALISLGFILVSRLKGRYPVYLLIIRFDSGHLDSIMKSISKLPGKLRNKNVAGNITELTMELSFSGNNTTFVDRISQMPGVESVSLVNYNGDYAA